MTTVDELRWAATRLLNAAGLECDMADAVADKLIESELLGHVTHGMAQLPTYLERLQDGRIATAGACNVVADTGATFSWQANRLAGAWVMGRAIQQALERSETQPVVTATIANCTHIGCLQAYLEAIGRRGRIALLMVTDPGVASVAPFGGADAVLTSNPIAVCIPTHGDPVLIDQATSLVSNGAVNQARARGERLPARWLLDHEGIATDDATALASEPPGTILPLGGEDFGYKGFGFGIMVEAFALALSGFGRKEPKVRGAQGIFLQVIDPSHFAGREAFLDETTDFVRRCKASRPAPGHREIRLPGERALRHKAQSLRDGIDLPADLLDCLDAWAAKLELPGARFYSDDMRKMQ